MKSSVIRWISLLLLVILSGCLTGNGTNQDTAAFVIASNSVNNVSDTSVTLMGGFMNTAGSRTKVTFEYGPTTAYGFPNPAPSPTTVPDNLSGGYVSVRQDMTGLTASTLYHFRMVVTQSNGTRTYSGDNTFTTLASLTPAAEVLPSPLVDVLGISQVTAPQFMAIDATNLYWTEFPSTSGASVATAVSSLGGLKMMPRAGGAVTTLAGGLTNPFGIAADTNGDVYFADTGLASINRVNKVTGGTGFTLSAITVNAAPVAPAITPAAGSLLTAVATVPVAPALAVGAGYVVGEILNVVLPPGVGGQVQVASVDALGGVLTIGAAPYAIGTGYVAPAAVVAPAVAVPIPTTSTGYAVNAVVQAPFPSPTFDYVAVDANNIFFATKSAWNPNAQAPDSDGAILKVPKSIIAGGTGLALTISTVTAAPVAPLVAPLAGGLLTVAIAANGSGYKVGDVLNVADTSVTCTAPVAPALAVCGVGGKVTVSTVGAGGTVTAVTILNPGSGYVATAVAVAPAVAVPATTSYTGVGFTMIPTYTALGNLAPITLVAAQVGYTPGFGYQVGEVLNFAPVVAGVVAAGPWGSVMVTAVDVNGGVTAADVLNGGGGFNAAFAAPAAGGFPTGFMGYALAVGLYVPQSLVVDNTNVYWSETANFAVGLGSVKYAPITPVGIPGAGTPIATGLTGGQFIATDANYVYYTLGTGSLARVSKFALTGTPQVVVTGMNGVQPFAINAGNIYWAEATTGLLKKASTFGGTNTVLAKDVVNPSNVVVDSVDNNVYWLQKASFNTLLSGWDQSGKIMSHAK